MEQTSKCRATGKTRYYDLGAAKQALLNIKTCTRFFDHIQGKRQNRRAGKPAQCRIYYCSHCQGWHLTSLVKKSLRKDIKQLKQLTANLLYDEQQAAEWKKDGVPFPELKNDK